MSLNLFVFLNNIITKINNSLGQRFMMDFNFITEIAGGVQMESRNIEHREVQQLRWFWYLSPWSPNTWMTSTEV